ncbi:hypothetical protein F0P96_13215 [Hymenobacter busanensis]|uniref:Uncharacterized protein n=1 Tax=Hymenobacter busanensis TaxID=2607656 RepID=A0A7L4ZWL0_9BACT|nr:hypothetical protein [Hymenobacter busanensis]KAA9332427.1 hypothetical protein F0P96_13215 [Hymenobacter busanensis]QHJ07235.1 hypothetical protein GUY19_08055 [Hymenobacter busanensis]
MSASLSFRTGRITRYPIVWQDFGSVAAMLLAIMCCLLSNAETDFHTDAPYLLLPSTTERSYCGPETNILTISLDKTNKVYFSHDSKSVQAAAIRQVAAKRGVYFTIFQQRELVKIPYLGMDVRKLPAYLSLPDYERRKITLLGIPCSEGDNQLSECITAARAEALRGFDRMPLISIRTDYRLPYARIKNLFRNLQGLHLYRYYLITHNKPYNSDQL